jgi:hypothetical protein
VDASEHRREEAADVFAHADGGDHAPRGFLARFRVVRIEALAQGANLALLH